MWEWNSKQFRTRRLDEEPALAAFASGLIVEWPGGIDVNRSILSRYRLRALPLVEWDLSPDAPSLFDALNRAGATKGFFIDYPDQEEIGPEFRECDLTSAAAAVVRDEDLFGSATIFVDDLFFSVIAAWFTDFTYLCMAPALFDQYLTANPLFLDIEGNEAELPADRFQLALRGAFKRLDDWSPLTLPVRAALDWQLVRTA
jgi:hypothetical protein